MKRWTPRDQAEGALFAASLAGFEVCWGDAHDYVAAFPSGNMRGRLREDVRCEVGRRFPLARDAGTGEDIAGDSTHRRPGNFDGKDAVVTTFTRVKK
jgi:hypothetical protein